MHMKILVQIWVKWSLFGPNVSYSKTFIVFVFIYFTPLSCRVSEESLKHIRRTKHRSHLAHIGVKMTHFEKKSFLKHCVEVRLFVFRLIVAKLEQKGSIILKNFRKIIQVDSEKNAQNLHKISPNFHKTNPFWTQ